jgi:WS/DGAT/MGAT family acyltransferase
MPAADAAWLHMDRAANPMVVNALVWFDEPLDWEGTREVFRQRIVARFPRFRQRVTEPLGRPAFEDGPQFDLDQHLHRLALPAPGDQATLQELVGDLITPPLDRSRPLWHAYPIEGFGAGCALLVRIHHCIADGIALARVMLSLTDGPRDAGIEPRRPTAGDASRAPLRSLLRSGAGALSATRKIAGTAVHEGLESLAHPQHAAHLAGVVAQDAGTLAKLLAAPADADTVLRQPLHGARRVAWSAPFPLADQGRRPALRGNCQRRACGRRHGRSA